MKKLKTVLIFPLIMVNCILMTSCWNYRESDSLAVVAGVAIDIGKNAKYEMTVEIIEMTSGDKGQMTPKIISVEGETMFDTARNMISLSGERLYWAHAKLIVLSKDVAEEGILKTIGWYTRDAETREDVYLLISEEKTAKEILAGEEKAQTIKSFDIVEMIGNQESLSKAPITDILKYDIEAKGENISSVIPTVKLVEIEGKKMPQLIGSAIIKDDRLIGFLDGQETQILLFIRDEIKGGILVEKMKTNDPKDEIATLSLEIFKSKTKVTPDTKKDDIKIDIDINTSVSLAEIIGVAKFNDEEAIKKIEQTAENSLNKQTLNLINKVQTKYSADIFGFGLKLREEDIKVWKTVEEDWENIFGYLEINVNSKISIKNSAKLTKPLEEGETN